MRVSQSILGQVDKCLLAAQFSLDPPAGAVIVGSPARLIGTAYHAGLEHFYLSRQHFGADARLQEMLAVAHTAFIDGLGVDAYTGQPIGEFKWDDKHPNTESCFDVIDAMLTEYINGGHAWPADWAVLGVEQSFKFDDPQLGGHTATGTADLVLQDPAEYIVVVDHKTAGKAWDQSKHLPRKQNQSPWYTNYFKKLYPDAPGVRFVFDVMTYGTAKSGPKFERRVSDPTAAHEVATVKKAADFAFLYQTVHVKAGMDLPANPASTLCNPKWCDFFDQCPHGAALE